MSRVSRRFCKRCLFYDGMRLWLHPRTLPSFVTPIRVDAEGRCSVCSAWGRWYSERLRSNEEALVRSAKARRAVVMLSGGKDSAATLICLRQSLDFRVDAVLYDNGHLPQGVVSSATRLCATLEVPLHVIDDPTGRPAFAREVREVSVDRETPCLTCARRAVEGTFSLARRLEAPWVFKGTNYFTSWDTVPQGLLPGTEDGFQLQAGSLPYILRFRRSDTAQLLEGAGYAVPAIVGVSSNCLVPGEVQTAVAEQLGHVPELEDLSLEVLVGHLERGEAIEVLRAKAPAHRHLLEGIED
jgi:PP-loop superfamily ATP-utilizing enzyme